MSDTRAAQPSSLRAVKAAAVVLAIVLSAPGVETLLRLAHSSSDSPVAAAGIDSRLLVQSGDPLSAIERIEGLAAADGGEVPAAFVREAGLLPGARSVRVDATGSVIGYVVAGDASDVNNALIECMKAAGWNAVSLGEMEGATFVKREGELTWMLATCTQVGEETSVVVRCK